MGKIHTILKSQDEILYKLEAWSKDWYLVNVYYNEFIKVDPEATLITYECDSVIELYNILKSTTSTTLEDVVEGSLRIKSSEDGRICVIYKDKYSECFSDSLKNSIIIRSMVESIYRKVITLSPLIIYLESFYGPIMNLLFKIYINKKNGDKYSIDLVYLWNYILKANIIIPDIISIPFNSVFLSVY